MNNHNNKLHKVFYYLKNNFSYFFQILVKKYFIKKYA